MTKKVFALDTKSGIQRDGTDFDKNFYNDGKWVRFQRGRPRKIWGYREIVNDMIGPSRGIFVNPQNAFTNVFNGHSNGLQRVAINDIGIGAGVVDFTLSDFTANENNLWQFDAFYDVTGGEQVLLAHPGQDLNEIDSTLNTPVLYGPINGTTLTKIGVFTVAASLNSSTTVTVTSTAKIGAGQKVTGTGIPANTYVASITSTTAFVITNAATITGSSTLTIDNEISVSGGVVSLHPYVFVYGNDGLIKNCSAGDPEDWVSADANETNAATGKIVQGLPVRGGSNAPSGLFWSLDSLIRVSYAPTNISVGGSTVTQYWRYDIVTSQSSILSSQGIIEYDGIFYWCGVDRFMLYNGVVKEIPNDMNQNWFFDNLNYSQRQKVWATKVTRFGEVWWFYPRGNATECTDAVIYNVREGIWYDAGSAEGARRSAGYFSQVFHYPVNAAWDENKAGAIFSGSITTAGSSYTNGTYSYYPLTGGTGTGATATIVVSGNVVTSVTIQDKGYDYTEGNVLSAVIPGGAGFTWTVGTTVSLVSLFQHEIGVDAVQNGEADAIESYIETNDLGLVSGGPSQPAMIGDNKWLRIERVEPDFIQTGEMECYVVGPPYADEVSKVSDPYPFGPNTGKIDMREQRREARLRFRSNVAGGDYQLGKVIISADIGDVRGYNSGS